MTKSLTRGALSVVCAITILGCGSGAKSDGAEVGTIGAALTEHAQTRRLRVATWNTYARPDWFDNGAPGNAPEHAIAVAETIKNRAPDIDVIALNEVFSETARWYLEEILAPYFPYHVSKIDALNGQVTCPET